MENINDLADTIRSYRYLIELIETELDNAAMKKKTLDELYHKTLTTYIKLGGEMSEIN